MSDVTKIEVLHPEGMLGWTVYVRNEFVKEHPALTPDNIDKLLAEQYMFRWIHNPSGPAVIREPNLKGPNNLYPEGREEYWLDGRHLEVEDPVLNEKMKHNHKFRSQLQDVLNND